MKRTAIALFAIALAACTNGQGQADVTLQNTVVFGGMGDAGVAVPSNVMLPNVAVTTDGEISIDCESELASMGKIGTLSATVSKNELSGDGLLQMQHIKAMITSADGSLPELLLTDLDVPENTTSIELPLSMSDATVLEYLEEGKVTIHFYVTGLPTTQPIMLTHTLVAHIDMAVQGSVTSF
ncbi:MAG TPA: hypothetical protein VK841_11685 [Polyangiaceae bacterium]|jgi:hypothetical protein|nr:hypothetical protein [Polyangiaceae bacterium]